MVVVVVVVYKQPSDPWTLHLPLCIQIVKRESNNNPILNSEPQPQPVVVQNSFFAISELSIANDLTLPIISPTTDCEVDQLENDGIDSLCNQANVITEAKDKDDISDDLQLMSLKDDSEPDFYDDNDYWIETFENLLNLLNWLNFLFCLRSPNCIFLQI